MDFRRMIEHYHFDQTKTALVFHDDSAEAVASACRVLNKRSIVIPGRRRLG